MFKGLILSGIVGWGQEIPVLCLVMYCGNRHYIIIENTSLMQHDKYIFHLYVFATCFGRDITHHQELQNCTHSDMVMVPREVRRDAV